MQLFLPIISPLQEYRCPYNQVNASNKTSCKKHISSLHRHAGLQTQVDQQLRGLHIIHHAINGILYDMAMRVTP